MEYAKDRGGNIVTASKAMAGVLGYYLCPVCKAEVFARQGKYYADHFAHRSKRARPECELYYPSDEIKGPVAPSRHAAEDREGPRPQLQIGLEVEPQVNAKTSQERRWRLQLIVPKASWPHGEIRVDCGSAHQPKIPLSKLALGPQSYPIGDLSAVDFRVTWFSPDVGPYYKESLSMPFPGLVRDRINVFRSQSQKLKPLARTLVYGSAYYFVWLTEANIALPPQVSSTPLAPNGEWSAALIVLPADTDTQLQNWLDNYCGISTVSDARRWGIIYPPLHGFDADGNVLVTPAKSVYLNVSRAADLDVDASLEIYSGREHTAIQLRKRTNRSIVGIANSQIKENSALTLRWDEHVLPSIRSKALQSLDTIPTVVLQFRPYAEHGFVSAKLHEKSGRDCFDRVRFRQWEVTKILYPAGAQGTLNWKNQNEFEWIQSDLTNQDRSDGKSLNLSERPLDSINARLHNLSIDVYLDFGAYGNYFSPAQMPPARAHHIFQPSLRKRIIWFCKRSQVYFSEDGRALETLNDQDLVRTFERCPNFPLLLSHRRIIARTIATHARPR